MSDLPIVLLSIASMFNTISIAFLIYKVYRGSRHE